MNPDTPEAHPHPGPARAPIYLDYNATTPVDPRVVDALLPYLTTHPGNPSSIHSYGTAPRQAVELARERVAALLRTEADRIVFTGSGSESDNLAIRGAALAHLAVSRRPVHIITQQTEHPAVLATCRSLARWHDVEVTYLPVDAHGLVEPELLAAAITPRTVLISIMWANNETGVLQPIGPLCRIAHEHGVLFHTDAAQAVGKIPVDVSAVGVDLLTLVGHKMYAPKGVAALYVRAGVTIEPLVYGGGQERGLRAGTENVALAVALGVAADLCRTEQADGSQNRLSRLRDRLHDRLYRQLPLGAVAVNGHPVDRLPNTLNLAIAGVSGDDVLTASPGIAASTGSACHSAVPEPSPVLTAMGQPPERAMSALRLSVGRWTTTDEIDQAAATLAASVRALLPPPSGSALDSPSAVMATPG